MNAKNLVLSAVALATLSACGGTSGGGGAAGSTGAAGSAGAAGSTGAAGSSGTAGSTSAGGSSGAAGATGSAGATASAGTTGSAGVTGSAGSTGTGGSTGTAGSSGIAGSGVAGSTGAAGAAGALTADQVKAKVDAYKAAHPGNGGKDWDVNAKSPAQLATDAAAKELVSLCGPGQRPVSPTIAWEYGGADHPWINPQASALVYCVYIPAVPSTDHWKYDAATMHVTADVYVKFPDQNPCKTQTGANQVLACLGDPTNIEILVDTASLDDGIDVGLDLACASTDLNLILPDGTRIHLFTGL